MRKLKKIAYLLLACLFLISSFSITASASEDESKANEIYYPQSYSGYMYPVHTGMAKWAKIIDHQDMVNACQIPEDVLENMSTADLAQTVISYPLSIDMFAYSTYSEGFEVVSEKFNGLKELKNRSDAATELLKQYLVLQNTVQSSESNSEQGTKADRRIVNLMTTELLLSQPVFQDQLTEDEGKTFTVNKEKQQSKPSDNILAAEPVYEAEVLGVTIYYYLRSVNTPNGVPVEVFEAITDFNSEKVGAINRDYDTVYTSATRLRDATAKYNCHSYAWYNSSSSKYWMNNPFEYYGGSNPCFSTITVRVSNAKVAYWTTSHNPTNSHSGIVTSVSSGSSTKYYVDKITVKSKWGGAGMYQHPGVHCPYWYDDTSIRTRYYN